MRSNSTEVTIARYLALALLACLAFWIANYAAGFFVSFVPGTGSALPSVLGYGLTGMLLGYFMRLLFREGAMKAAFTLPGFMLLAQLIWSSYLFSSSNRYFDVPRLLEYLFTHFKGLALLVILSAGAIAAIWLLQRQSRTATAL